MMNEALWMRSPGATPVIGSAPVLRATVGEIMVRCGAIAVDPVDRGPCDYDV